MPRNPSVIKFFRYSKLAENAGYGIDKIIRWEAITGNKVTIHSDLLVSTVEYPLVQSYHRNKAGENNGENNDKIVIIDAIKQNAYISQPKLAEKTGFSLRKVNRIIAALRDSGRIKRIGKTKGGHWEIVD